MSRRPPHHRRPIQDGTPDSAHPAATASASASGGNRRMVRLNVAPKATTAMTDAIDSRAAVTPQRSRISPEASGPTGVTALPDTPPGDASR